MDSKQTRKTQIVFGFLTWFLLLWASEDRQK